MLQQFSKDKILYSLVQQFGVLQLSQNHMQTSNNLFTDLVSSIVRQQLSNTAGEKVFRRLQQALQMDITVERILKCSESDLQTIGLSRYKIKYLQCLATAVQTNALQLDIVKSLSDDEVIQQLTKIKGIGQWTAEMFLLFSLQRPDVFAFGDLGLKKAMQNLYNNANALSKQQMETIAENWRPYRSYACLYLWKSLE